MPIRRRECLKIRGGVPLRGTVRVNGSKNAALPIMAASLLADGPIRLDRIPDLADVDTLAALLRHLGVRVDCVDRRRHDGMALRLETHRDAETQAPYQFVRRMRASFCLLGPLLAKRGAATVALPGGCNLGCRPVDLHLRGLAALGADIRLQNGYVVARAGKLRGAEIDMVGPMGPTVTGTANVISAAVLARGRTLIHGAAREPEIVDLGRFLLGLGARIDGLGTSTVEIDGVENLVQQKSYDVIADRIEAATLLIAVATAGGHATFSGVDVQQLTALLSLLDEMGVRVSAEGDHLSIESSTPLRSFQVSAMPYPEIPTDIQPLLSVAAAVASGRSRICDNVFPSRWLHVGELQRMGATIRVAGDQAVIDGRPGSLVGARVTARDLRGAAALALAGVAATGTTVLSGTHHLDRGYERLERKLSLLGADMERRLIGRRSTSRAGGSGRESLTEGACIFGSAD